MGAPYPDKATAALDPTKTHWAYQPVRDPIPPAPKTAAEMAIDRFVLARLEAKGLTLSPPADRRTLIRRVTYDLTGLMPTPEEVEAFENDPSPTAYE